MASFLKALSATLPRTIVDRLRRGPMRPTWSFGFELIARTLKRHALDISQLDWAAQRRAWEAGVQPSPVLKELRAEASSLGGVAGEWFSPSRRTPNASVVLYFHGGAFIYGSPKTTHREVITRHMLASGGRIFAVEYRLAPEHPFPAASDDALAAYRGLLESGVDPRKIVMAGESAGGNLAIVTLLRAREANLPLPAGVVAVSPWVDLTARGGSLVANAVFDWAEPEDFVRWEKTYLAGHDPRDALASPAFADLAGLPPLLVQLGEAEMLYDQVQAFAERARSQRADLTLSVYPDMIHNWHVLAGMFARCQDAIDEIGAFVRRVTGAA
jgi:acetyl esterase/lipase